MLFHLSMHKKGGGQLFAICTILCIAAAVWIYFLFYIPSFDSKFSKTSEIQQLIENAKKYLSQNDYLNAFEVVKVAKTLKEINPAYVDALKSIESQAILQEFESKLQQAEELSDIGSLEESDTMLKSLKSKLSDDSELKTASGNENLKKIEKFESRNRVKELEFLIEEIEKLIKQELFSDAGEKIRAAYLKIDIAEKFKDFNKDIFVERLKVLEREKEQLSVEDTINEIDLLISNEVSVEAYQIIRTLEKTIIRENLKQRLQNLRQRCEEKLCDAIINDAESLEKSGEYQKALEVLKLADAYEFQSEELLSKIENERLKLKAAITTDTGNIDAVIVDASNQIEKKQYEEALKTLGKLNSTQNIKTEHARAIGKLESKARIYLEYVKAQYNKDAVYINNYITLEITTNSGDEYFGSMYKVDYQRVKSAITNDKSEKSSKVVLMTHSAHDTDRKYIMLDVSEISEYTTFTISEIDETLIETEIQFWSDSLISDYDASEAYKLALFIKVASDNADKISSTEDMINKALSNDEFLWQSLMLRKSEFFKKCVTNILSNDANAALMDFDKLVKLFPFADKIRKISDLIGEGKFAAFKKNILDNTDRYGKNARNEKLVQLNGFQLKLLEKDETGIINYADKANSLALESLSNFNNYNPESYYRLGLSEYYSRLAVQMLMKAKSKGAVVDSKINEILRNLYKIKILMEY